MKDARSTILKSVLKSCHKAMASEKDEDFDDMLKGAKKQAVAEEKPEAKAEAKKLSKKDMPSPNAAKSQFLDFIKAKMEKTAKGRHTAIANIHDKHLKAEKPTAKQPPVKAKPKAGKPQAIGVQSKPTGKTSLKA